MSVTDHDPIEEAEKFLAKLINVTRFGGEAKLIRSRETIRSLLEALAVLRGRLAEAEDKVAWNAEHISEVVTLERDRRIAAEASVVSLKEALRLIDSPYPESIFTPLYHSELDSLYYAMRQTSVTNPTERLYAQFARERGEAVRAALASSEGQECPECEGRGEVAATPGQPGDGTIPCRCASSEAPE